MTDQQPGNPLGFEMPDLGGLLQSAQKMMADAQAASEEVVEGVSGGGLVKVEVDGRFEFHSISIDTKAVDADDPTILEDLVLAALRDASVQLRKRQEGALSGTDLGGMDLNSLGLDVSGGLDSLGGMGAADTDSQ